MASACLRKGYPLVLPESYEYPSLNPASATFILCFHRYSSEHPYISQLKASFACLLDVIFSLIVLKTHGKCPRPIITVLFLDLAERYLCILFGDNAVMISFMKSQ